MKSRQVRTAADKNPRPYDITVATQKTGQIRVREKAYTIRASSAVPHIFVGSKNA
jgi:hypothetical protein